jgi:hypothetical protein
MLEINLFGMLMLYTIEFLFAITTNNRASFNKGCNRLATEVMEFLSEGEQSEQESVSSIDTVCVEKLAPKMAFCKAEDFHFEESEESLEAYLERLEQ